MPKLWEQTVDQHRHAVQEAIMQAGWRLVAQRGLLSVTMTEIAREAGIGRATLYKYFPDVESVLRATHRRHVQGHLAELEQHATGPGSATERLEELLRSYAQICYLRDRRVSAELTALLHGDPELVDAEGQIHALLVQALDKAASSGDVAHAGVSTNQLADYCLHALGAAARAPDQAAVGRLVELVLRSLRPRMDLP